MTELEALADRLNKATDYTDIFGKDPNTTAQQVKDIYRKLARVVHPDGHTGTDHDTATQAFQLLYKYREDAEHALAMGQFGGPVVRALIRTKRSVHQVYRKLGDGDIAGLYLTTTGEGFDTEAGLLKVARNVRDNDLMAAEAKALKTLHSVDDKMTRHYPLLLDSFTYRDDAGHSRRRANVVAWHDSSNLLQLREAFPAGMDPRHVTWIWRRLLMALGFAHDQGLVHGAVLPPHILILPEQHGVILVDWCYSVTDSSPIKAVVSDYRDWYPEEVTTKTAPSPATDIAMAARCMIYLLGGCPPSVIGPPATVPRQMRSFFKGCLLTKQSMRPDNAWALLAEFDEVLERIGEPYHPRRFIELVVTAAT